MQKTRFLCTVIISLTLGILSLGRRGEVFASPSERVLWSFGGTGDGGFPLAGLLKVGGNLYGSTFADGANGNGALFELTPPAPSQTSWSERVRWNFGNSSDGASAYDGLIEMGGNLYGTTVLGGANGLGAVFELTPPAPGQTIWSEKVLWSFGGSAGDGTSPLAGLIEVGGRLYGTTAQGGANVGPFGAGLGTVFELTAPAPGQATWNEGVLRSFGGTGDGTSPAAGLIEAGGKLYGTTYNGGANGYGAVFQLAPPAPGQTAWSESVLWSFSIGDGSFPHAGLIEMDGRLYGTTYGGGANHSGTAFELTPPAPGQTGWGESVLWSFGGAGDGTGPYAGLIDVGGKLYGTTLLGGANDVGAIFKLTPPAPGQGWGESVLWSFGGAGDGMGPYASLIDVGGNLYGTAGSGGANNAGVVFAVSP